MERASNVLGQSNGHVHHADRYSVVAEACRRLNLEAPEHLPAPGQDMRLADLDKPRARDGWLKVLSDGAGFHIQNHVTMDRPETVFFDRRSLASMSAAEREAIAQARREAEERQRLEYDQAAERCAQLCTGSHAASPEHPYLVRKGIGFAAAFLRQEVDHSARDAQHGGGEYAPPALLVPLINTASQIRTIQRIDADGGKTFHPGGQVADHFFIFHSGGMWSEGPIYLAEGMATAATLFRVTERPAAACFTAANMANVARILRRRYPTAPIHICADDDVKQELRGKANAGLVRARKAAEETRSFLAVPDFTQHGGRGAGSDFNDLEQAGGAEAVRRSLKAAALVSPPITVVTDEEEKPLPCIDPECGESDLAECFAQWRRGDMRYVLTWHTWMVYQGGVWKPEKTGFAYERIHAMCSTLSRDMGRDLAPKRLKTAKTRAAVETIAKVDRRLAARDDQWDRDPWLLNTPGGVVDLRTGDLLPHRPELYMTKSTAATPGGACPRWLAFLHQVTGGDASYMAFLQRLAGYMLTGITREQILAFAYGPGGNGKGVFMDTLSNILADYAKTAAAETFLEQKSGGDRHSCDLAALRGARLVTSQEIGKDRSWAEARIKELTGEDPITCRVMRGDPFTYRPEFKILIAANTRPKFRVIDDAIRRRLMLLPFTVSFKGARNDRLRAELLEEAAGILQWAIEGCLAWQREGLNPPEIVTTTTADYLEAEDDTGRWLEDRTVRDPNARTPLKTLFHDWAMWADGGLLRKGKDKELAERLENEGFARYKSRTERGFVGIRIKNEAELGLPERPSPHLPGTPMRH